MFQELGFLEYWREKPSKITGNPKYIFKRTDIDKNEPSNQVAIRS